MSCLIWGLFFRTFSLKRWTHNTRSSAEAALWFLRPRRHVFCALKATDLGDVSEWLFKVAHDLSDVWNIPGSNPDVSLYLY